MFQYALVVQGGVVTEPFQETPSVQDLGVQVEARARVFGDPSLTGEAIPELVQESCCTPRRLQVRIAKRCPPIGGTSRAARRRLAGERHAPSRGKGLAVDSILRGRVPVHLVEVVLGAAVTE